MGDIAVLVILPPGKLSKDDNIAYAQEIVDNYLGTFRPKIILADEEMAYQLSLAKDIYIKNYLDRCKRLEEQSYCSDIKKPDYGVDENVDEFYRYQIYDSSTDLGDIMGMIGNMIANKLDTAPGIVFWGYESTRDYLQKLYEKVMKSKISYNAFSGAYLPKHNFVTNLLSILL